MEPASRAPPGPDRPPRRPWWDLPHRLLLRRALSTDLTRVEPTEAERAALDAAGPGALSPATVAYLAWRRGPISLATTAGVPLLVFGLIHLIGQIADASDQQQGGDVLVFLALLEFGAKVFLFVVLLRSLGRWTEAAWTRRWLRWGWFVALVTPVLITMIPLVGIVMGESSGFGGAARQANVTEAARQAQAALKDLGGLLIAVVFFWKAVPGVLSLFPGLLRAGLATKTAFPGRGLGPVAAACLTPIQALFLVAVLIQVQQVVSSVLFFFGIVLVALAPLAYAREAVRLFRPMEPGEASAGAARIRRVVRWCQIPGVLLLLVPLLGKRLFGAVPIIGFSEHSLLGVFAALGLLASFVVMIQTYTVVAADGLVQAMHLVEVRGREDRAQAAWQRTSGPVGELAGLLGPLGIADAATRADPAEDG